MVGWPTKTAKLPPELGTGTFIEFREATKGEFDEFKDTADELQQNRFLARIIRGWDCIDPNTGAVMPITPESILNLHPLVYQALINAMGGLESDPKGQTIGSSSSPTITQPPA